MEYLLELLSTYIENEQQRQLVFVALSGAAIFSFAAALLFLGGNLVDPVRRRLHRLGGQRPETRPRRHSERIAEALAPSEKYILPKSDWERSAMQARLVHAGYRSPNALTNFYALKVLLTLCLPLLTLVVTRFYPQLTVPQIWGGVTLAAGVGVFGPNAVLHRQVRARQRCLRESFPDALDLLVVCVESGLGLVAALQRVSRDLDISHPELAEELALVNTETRLGVPRMEALKNLARRTGLEEIQSLVVLLDQSARFGTSIADSLRVFSEEFRDKRTQAAEEAAAKIGTKLIFPLTLCLWPAFFVVVVGPAAMRIVEALQHF
ncbi:type II secretion system F family protein [Marinimicrobium sp. C2-29]|uniref:type II secretion system F family protein n=1 Tax=Marinimicrobium sp. C2-29 TaxID=3139825 RepID=UPI00313A331B